jgi:periplasmic divalent cation tolerance protein
MSFVILMTTVARRADAKRLSQMAVRKRLAACVQAVPGVRSAYRWKGKIEDSAEILLLFKTTKKALPGLIKAIKATHPYDLPELVSVAISGGSREYLNWIAAEVTAGKSRQKS